MNLDHVRQMPPVARFLYWVTEREGVRLRREAGDPKPWTDDEVLLDYRFCNVRRMDDKVSRWLLDNWYGPWKDHYTIPPAAALARFINLPSSLERITEHVFPDWRPDRIKATLRALRDEEEGPVFNGAYMVRGNDGPDKVASVVDHYVQPLVTRPVTTATHSMRVTWNRLMPSYGLGSFMAGQIVADLRWALEGTWADRHIWAPRGPGSVRGLNRLRGLPPGTPMDYGTFLDGLTEVIELCRTNLPASIHGRLEAMDYQNCLCETDKYERCLWGGRSKQTYPGRG